MNNEAFMLVPNQWSPVHVPLDGQIVFFYLQDRTQHMPEVYELEMGKAILSMDAQLCMAKILIDRIQKKKAIVIPMQKDGEEEKEYV